METVVGASCATLNIYNFSSPTIIDFLRFYQHRDETLRELLIVHYVSGIMKTLMANQLLRICIQSPQASQPSDRKPNPIVEEKEAPGRQQIFIEPPDNLKATQPYCRREESTGNQQTQMRSYKREHDHIL